MSNSNKKTSRRFVLKSIFTSVAVTGAGMFGFTARAKASNNQSKDVIRIPDETESSKDKGPLFSGSTTYNGLVFIAGKGYHGEGDITKHTIEVLNLVERELIKAGSSMDKVLKVNVYLADLADYDAMNEVYRGRFGDEPPVRTTVACNGGIPGKSLVEIDCIATTD